VLEYLDGTNLEELIDTTGPLPVERALLITAQITRALEAAHAADVIHRDLKPANVMLINRKGEDDFVKVLDFGISKDLDMSDGERRAALTRPDVAIGTPVYMAPEQAAGRPANALTDVYALGGLLYDMLTGCPPCAGADAIDVLHKKANEDPVAIGTLRPGLPPEVERLVERALARAPRERHPSMTTMKDEVLACLGVVDRAGTGPAPLPRQTVSATPVLPPPSTGRVRRARLVPGAIVVGLGAACAVGGVAILLFGHVTPEERAPVAMQAAEPTTPTSTPATTLPDPPAVAPAARATTAVETEATPWPEREATPAAAKQPEIRLNKELRSSPLRRQFGMHAGTALGARPVGGGVAALGSQASRAPARHTSVAELAAQTDPTQKTAGALVDRPGAAPADAILGRGQTAFDRGDYPEAVRRGREAIAAGGALGGHLLVGDAYYRLERFPDALREYQAALALDPANSSIKRRRDLAEKASPP
jgi:hypothetical protein